jgi:hypothetical protein
MGFLNIASHMNGFPKAAGVDKFHGFIKYCLQRLSETLKAADILKLNSYGFKGSRKPLVLSWKGFQEHIIGR